MVQLVKINSATKQDLQRKISEIKDISVTLYKINNEENNIEVTDDQLEQLDDQIVASFLEELDEEEVEAILYSIKDSDNIYYHQDRWIEQK